MINGLPEIDHLCRLRPQRTKASGVNTKGRQVVAAGRQAYWSVGVIMRKILTIIIIYS